MSRTLNRVLTVLAAAAVSIGLLSVPAHASDTSRYVALGDSFTAGPLISIPTQSPLGCLKSKKNYPNKVAAALNVDEFVDISCSGATTEDLWSPQKTLVGTNPAQLDAVTPETTLVSLGISGNDVGFVDMLVTCAKKSVTNPNGHPCQDHFVDSDTGYDELRARITETAPKVSAVIAAIIERAPNAHIVIVGYPAIMPETQGCWPKVPVSKQDVPYLDGIEQELNAMLADQAAAYGATYVDVYERGHDVCQSRSDRWVEGIIPTRPAAPVHPNANGMEAVADRILEIA